MVLPDCIEASTTCAGVAVRERRRERTRRWQVWSGGRPEFSGWGARRGQPIEPPGIGSQKKSRPERKRGAVRADWVFNGRQAASAVGSLRSVPEEHWPARGGRRGGTGSATAWVMKSSPAAGGQRVGRWQCPGRPSGLSLPESRSRGGVDQQAFAQPQVISRVPNRCAGRTPSSSPVAAQAGHAAVAFM